MSRSPTLTAEQVARFDRDGILILRQFYDLKDDIEPIQHGIHTLIGQVMKRHGQTDSRPPFQPQLFDDGFQPLIAADRMRGSEIYDAVKQIPAFIRLLGDVRHETLFRELRPGSIPGIAANGYGIRIDNPYEERFRAGWHQEYPSQLRSLDGLVFWSPLLEITPERGPVQFCPGSHRTGPIPVTSKDPDNPNKTGAYGVRLQNEEEVLSHYPRVAPLTMPGDLIVIDFLTLHASGANVSDRSRWTMQFRYFNFDEPTGLAHGWQGSFAAGVDFRKIHPELCAE